MTKPAMIISMPTIARSQQRYDQRLRNLVQRTRDVTVATDLGVCAYRKLRLFFQGVASVHVTMLHASLRSLPTPDLDVVD